MHHLMLDGGPRTHLYITLGLYDFMCEFGGYTDINYCCYLLVLHR